MVTEKYTLDELLERKPKPYIKDKPEYLQLNDWTLPEVDNRIEIEIWDEGKGIEVDMVKVIKRVCEKFVIDQYKTVYIEFDGKLLPIHSNKFKIMLHGIYYKLTNKTIGKEKINSVLAVIESHAYNVGEARYLYNRICWEGDPTRILYDLNTEENEYITISSNGWNFIDLNQPQVFKHWTHQREQVKPKQEWKKENIELLKPFLPVRNEDWLLVKVYVCSLFIPDIPHPVLCSFGPPGSGKSTISKLIKRLVDPSVIDTSAFPKDQSELIQKMAHHYFIGFDNITWLQDWQSDILCRAVTGQGFSKRQLYTDQEDVLFSFTSCVGLNGINIVPRKSDLLDRSVLIEIDRIGGNKIIEDKELIKKFEDQKGRILDGILTIVSGALDIKDDLDILYLPRMADFAVWGEAISIAMGNNPGDFMEVYLKNIEKQNEVAISASIVGDVIRKFVDEDSEIMNEGQWEGTPSSLLNVLKGVAEEMGMRPEKNRGWPKAANSLMARINEIKENFRNEGITIDTFHDGQRRIVSLVIDKALRSSLINRKPNDGQYDTPKNIVRLKSQENRVIKPNLTMNDTNDDARTLYHPTNTIYINDKNTSSDFSEKTVSTVLSLVKEEIPQNSLHNGPYEASDPKSARSLVTVSTVEDSTPTINKNSYMVYDCPWSLRDIIEEIIEIYSIPLTRNQFILALGKNSYITNAVFAYEAAIQEKIIQERNGRTVLYKP